VPLRNNNVAGATDRQIHYVTFGRFGPERTARFLGGNALSFPGSTTPRTRCPSYPSKLTTFTTRAYTSRGLQAW
jgi:hypothetical protein